jgi:hypothetical protein
MEATISAQAKVAPEMTLSKREQEVLSGSRRRLPSWPILASGSCRRSAKWARQRELQSLGTIGTAMGDQATTTAQVLTGLIVAFGGLGLTATLDRWVQAINTVAAAQQLPAPIARRRLESTATAPRQFPLDT